LSFIERFIALRSSLVRVTTVPPANGGGYSETNLTLFPTSPGAEWVDLANGDDAFGDLSVDDFVGQDGGSGNRTGIQALEDIEEISLVAAPGMWSSTVSSALILHSEQLRYRFAVIDPPVGLSIQGVRDFRDAIDTKYAALYHPWIEVRDPLVKRNVIVAPSLHMLGLYARVDVNRGVHKAPANEVLGGITRISDDVNQREQDMLNPKGINALRFFPGRGNRVWGARTLSSDSSWKYINVRRIFIYVEASIDRGTQWVVFEPNDEPLWARVRATITNFLTSTWRAGMLQGTTPDEAFFVKVDRTTMTQDDIDNGRLICLIGIAPVYPAEFVIFRIQQKTLEANQA
jgi:phage tail sheath protein FI